MASNFEVEVKIEALEEFVVDTLKGFKSRLDDMERGINEKLNEELSEFRKTTVAEFENKLSVTIKTEMEKVKEEFKEKIPMDVSAESTESTSPKPLMWGYIGRQSTPRKTIPTNVKDIENEPLQSELAEIAKTVKYIKAKEFLKPVQLYYVHYWMARNKGVTGRSEDAEHLMYDGIKDEIWPANWKPAEASGTMKAYLMEKIKGINKRKDVEAQKQSYSEKLNNKL